MPIGWAVLKYTFYVIAASPVKAAAKRAGRASCLPYTLRLSMRHPLAPTWAPPFLEAPYRWATIHSCDFRHQKPLRVMVEPWRGKRGGSLSFGVRVKFKLGWEQQEIMLFWERLCLCLRHSGHTAGKLFLDVACMTYQFEMAAIWASAFSGLPPKAWRTLVD